MVSARRGEVRWFFHGGKPPPGRDARGARAGGQQRGLADAESLIGREHGRGAEHFAIREIEKRVVADFVAHRVIQRDCALAL
jgi:hypothetical protein